MKSYIFSLSLLLCFAIGISNFYLVFKNTGALFVIAYCAVSGHLSSILSLAMPHCVNTTKLWKKVSLLVVFPLGCTVSVIISIQKLMIIDHRLIDTLIFQGNSVSICSYAIGLCFIPIFANKK